MNPSPLPDRDQRATQDAYNESQRSQPNKLLGLAVIGALSGVGLASLTTEFAIAYRVFAERFAPEFPGEPMHGPVGIMALSTVLASAAFHLYQSKNPSSAAGVLLGKAVPWLSLGFICSMGLMAATSVLDASGIPVLGADAPLPDLFAEEQAASQVSLLDRISIGAFGFGLAGLALCNFWLTQRIADELWKRIKPMFERRAVARETSALMDQMNSDDARLSALGAEREMLLRELQPQASFAFATELAVLVQKLRGPVVGVITGGQIWKKRPDSILERKDEPELELSKFRELAGALDLTPEKIFAAFNPSHEVKKK